MLRILILAQFLAGAPALEVVPAAPPVAAARTAADPTVAALRADLARMVQTGARGDRWSVLVVSLDRGDTLFAHGAHDALAPASNMKLFTSAAGLYYLGPDYRFSTYLVAHGTLGNGVLDGDLILYGTGDPTISGRFGDRMRPLRAFADSLESLGIREVRGAVVGDASYFTGSGAGHGWNESYMNAAYAATASALSFSENVATLRVTPGTEPGWRPTIRLVPGGEGVAVVNQATTTRSGATSIRVTRSGYDGPLVVRGQIALNHPGVTSAVPLSDPGRYMAAALRELLEERGIVVHGGVRGVELPEESVISGRSVFAPAYDGGVPVRVLAVHTSPPLLEILNIINQRSHNLMSEQVLRAVGRVALGEGTADAGARAIRAMMKAETGHEPSNLEIYDGSGLSAMNRASAASIVQLLGVMPRSPEWEAYWSTLPEAGLANLRRMHRTAAEQNLRAKTGTINNVSALSGYVRAANGERLAFSIVANQVPSTYAAKRIEDNIGARIASFQRPAEGMVIAEEAAPAPEDEATVGEQRATAPPPPTATQPQRATASGPRTHTIRSGDTLDRIARENGLTVRALQQANPGLDARRLIPGRQVRLPR
jgi:serine-type D-Ala-D-Ala carboxypeptidase/endopeptidase (penicillin-binding protein 4)